MQMRADYMAVTIDKYDLNQRILFIVGNDELGECVAL